MEQFKKSEDLKTTQTIRQAIMKEATLSLWASNILIATYGGHVSLIGLVRSLEQKMRTEAIAKSVAGEDKVHSQIHMAEAKDPAEANARDQQNRGRDVFQKFNDRASETRARPHIEVRE